MSAPPEPPAPPSTPPGSPPADLLAVLTREAPPEPMLPEGVDLPSPVAAVDAALANVPTAPSAPPEEKPRAKLYDPQRRGYMRATREEGIRDELAAMNAEARGTPFFGKRTTSTAADPRARLGLRQKLEGKK